MAKQINILRTIEQEINRGNTLIDETGLFISPSKVQAKAQAQYMKDMKEGVLDMSTTPANYMTAYEEKNYIKALELSLRIKVMLSHDTDIIGSEPVATLPEPSEPSDSEPVATLPEPSETSESNKTVSKDKKEKVNKKEVKAL